MPRVLFAILREVTLDYARLRQSAFLGKTIFRPAELIAVYIAQKQAGFRFEDVSPENSVALRAFPVLLICGATDRKIPCRHSQAIYRSAIGPKGLWVVPAQLTNKPSKRRPQNFSVASYNFSVLERSLMPATPVCPKFVLHLTFSTVDII